MDRLPYLSVSAETPLNDPVFMVERGATQCARTVGHNGDISIFGHAEKEKENDMRSKRLISAAVALSVGLCAVPAFAFEKLTPEQENDPAINGQRLLGIDISKVDLTVPSVQSFLASLSPQAHEAVLSACVTAQTSIGDASRVDAEVRVLPFCDLANAAGTFTPTPGGLMPAPAVSYPVGGAAG
jgi:hypothetical protein